MIYGQTPTNAQSLTVGLQEDDEQNGNSNTYYTCNGVPYRITPNLALLFVSV